jgi:hypothetical protein
VVEKKPTPNRFRPGENNESNDRSDQRKKLIHASENHFIDNALKIKQLNEAMGTSRRALDYPGVSGHLSLATRVGLNQITESTSSNTAGLNQINGSDSSKPSIEELVNLSLTYEVLRGLTRGKIPFLHQVQQSNDNDVYLNALATRALEVGEEEQKKTCHLKVERRKCQEKGCTKQAHACNNFTHCSTHNKSPRKLCVVCKKNYSRRKGGLCDTCSVVKTKEFCVNCTKNGFKRLPRNIGGLCAVCINNGVKIKKKCTKCNTGKRRHKGGICRACFKKGLLPGKIA